MKATIKFANLYMLQCLFKSGKILFTVKIILFFTGQAMSVKMTTPASAKVKAVPEKLPSSETPVASGPLR